MSKLLATVPLQQGVAMVAALNRAADRARARGDERSRGQVMADTLVGLVTGQQTAEGVPLRVDLIITDQSLFTTGRGADEPATLSGHGPVPAPWARELITSTAAEIASVTSPAAADSSIAANGSATPAATAVRRAAPAPMPVPVQIRRLFTDPGGRLVTMETGSRDFTPAMAEFVRLRDQRCTTPFCGAPIRHVDHVLPWARGGSTSLVNAAGKCEACNYASQAPGWTFTPLPGGGTTTRTPTGHDLGAPPPARQAGGSPISSLERATIQLLTGHGRRPPRAVRLRSASRRPSSPPRRLVVPDSPRRRRQVTMRHTDKVDT